MFSHTLGACGIELDDIDRVRSHRDGGGKNFFLSCEFKRQNLIKISLTLHIDSHNFPLCAIDDVGKDILYFFLLTHTHIIYIVANSK